ncbi:phenylalanine--tRNA ligase beta subunit-related protein [Tunturiibacter empetritectus]|uniref:phenylalanine--tRNA ligase beta subunit-related protein n=1 Tax=Tunturiibacter empetritectus TaxID=3069691 RepID=UPI003D9B50C8
MVDAPFPVRIASEATGLCGRFTAQVIRNVTIAPSSARVADYFTLLGQKQISNAVDASNFVLLGMGHPTHAFDLDKIEGGIVVRLAHKGEKLKLLDGTDRTLEADDLVVADEKKALALAGVMGGWDSMITPETKNILVESAWFDPATVRRRLASPRPPHRRLPPLRARRRLQRCPHRQRPRHPAHPAKWSSRSPAERQTRRRTHRPHRPRSRSPYSIASTHRALRQTSPAPPRHHHRPARHHLRDRRPVPHLARLQSPPPRPA